MSKMSAFLFDVYEMYVEQTPVSEIANHYNISHDEVYEIIGYFV